MESTGQRDRIQVSQSTADLLVASGRGDWITKRDGLVAAKGKGELQTYWLVGRTTSAGSTYTTVTEDKMNEADVGVSDTLNGFGPIGADDTVYDEVNAMVRPRSDTFNSSGPTETDEDDDDAQASSMEMFSLSIGA
jgi:hypothetical protein